MKKILYLFVCICLFVFSASAERLKLPEIDIDNSASAKAAQPESAATVSADSLKSSDVLNFSEFDKFPEETVSSSDVQPTDVSTPDFTNAFGNLENLTKTLYSNFQNAFATIKSLNSKYNTLTTKYQALVKKYNNDVKLIIGKAQNLKKQYVALNESNKKALDENSALKQKVQQQEELIAGLKNSVAQKNAQLQNLSSKYDKLVLKIQQIKTALTVE